MTHPVKRGRQDAGRIAQLDVRRSPWQIMRRGLPYPQLGTPAMDTRRRSRTVREAALVRQIYQIVDRLEALFPGHRSTPDGHTADSIGEVFAAACYGLDLPTARGPLHHAPRRRRADLPSEGYVFESARIPGRSGERTTGNKGDRFAIWRISWHSRAKERKLCQMAKLTRSTRAVETDGSAAPAGRFLAASPGLHCVGTFVEDAGVQVAARIHLIPQGTDALMDQRGGLYMLVAAGWGPSKRGSDRSNDHSGKACRK
jgi:hypothetical protein